MQGGGTFSSKVIDEWGPSLDTGEDVEILRQGKFSEKEEEQLG